MSQTTNSLLMVRPASFRANTQTAVNNHYQDTDDQSVDTRLAAIVEFEAFVAKLREAGIDVTVVNDTPEPETPDALFPNNWVSFHVDGTVALYPMFAPNRRTERRLDILDTLKRKGFRIERIVDYTSSEAQSTFLEGTGSIVLDREHHVAYACESVRTNKELLQQFCDDFGYQMVLFGAYQSTPEGRMPIYHTNVMMCVGDTFAVICSSCIDDEQERAHVISTLQKTGHEVIEISEDQVNHFAGNMLQVEDSDGNSVLVMSSQAYNVLTEPQRNILKQHATIVHSSLTTIERFGGGSARCMLAEVFLPKQV